MLDFTKSQRLIDNAKSIVIFTHVDVDGDAIGSAFALYYYLTEQGKSVDVVSDSQTIPNQTNFLNIEDKINKKASSKKYDLAIITDCNNVDRLGVNKLKMLEIRNTIQFDHHPNNTNFALVNNCNEKASSACEVVASYFFNNNIQISKKVCECLLLGIITDSGGFRFGCTSLNTMEIVYKLLSISKIDLPLIMKSVFESETINSFKMYRYAMNNTEFLADGKFALIKIDNKFLKDNKINHDECKILTRIGTEIASVKVVAVVCEVEENVSKVSFRSRGDFDISVCAKAFGGGGHLAASGCKIYGNFYNTIQGIKRVVKEAFSWDF